MDEAGARARIKSMTRPQGVKKLEDAIEETRIKKEDAIKEQQFETAASMRDEEKKSRRNNVVVSAAAISALAVFGIILTL